MTEKSTKFLALYTGPNGPISIELPTADTLREAAAAAHDEGSSWYSDACDHLDLPPGAVGEEIDAALAADGWKVIPSVVEGYWDIHERQT